MKSFVTFAFFALTTVASFGASTPDLKIQDAITTSNEYVVTTKYIPSAFYVSSAVFTKEADGRKTWRVQYDPIEASPRKDAWFIVVVEMNKSCGIIQQK
jgi:hypothetical protein